MFERVCLLKRSFSNRYYPMEEKTLDALKEAIAKYRAIEHETDAAILKMRFTSSTCALCKLFIENDHCEGCPVAAHAPEHSGCRNTPWHHQPDMIGDLLYTRHDAYTDDLDDLVFNLLDARGEYPDTFRDMMLVFRARCAAEAEFLESLLPKEDAPTTP